MFVGTQSTDGWSERGKQSTSPLPSGILKQEAERAAATSLGPWDSSPFLPNSISSQYSNPAPTSVLHAFRKTLRTRVQTVHSSPKQFSPGLSYY